MTRVLLDTSAYSSFMRGDSEAGEAVRGAEFIAVNAVVLGELLAGFDAGSRRKKNEEELRELLASPRVAVLTIDEETAERYALILGGLRRAGTPIPTNDIWIAACAMQHGLGVLTADAHYLKVPQVAVRCIGAPS